LNGVTASAARRLEADDVRVVRPAVRLRGQPRLPGDKSISHRALLLALLAEGETHIEAAGDGADVRSTATAVSALGASVERAREADGRVDYRVVSRGRPGVAEPTSVIDCGNSGTTTRLLAGVLAGAPVRATLDGDDSLRRRPMARVTGPLRQMGAAIDGPEDGGRLPLTIHGRQRLAPLDHSSVVPSAQVKSAILLAGLAADGTTSVHESTTTRDHTERMLRARGVTVTESTDTSGAHTVSLDGPAAVGAVDERVPADTSAAAFWLVAAAIHPDAELTLAGVSTNPTRRAIIDLLGRMGADIDERTLPASGAEEGEPVADLVVRSSLLRAIDLSPADVAAAIDEIPILCLAAAVAQGRTRIRGAGELRHKESDRIAGIVAGLSSLGARIEADGDNIVIDGESTLTGGPTDSLGDHRLAMTFAIGGLIARGETLVRQAGCADVSYPGFFGDLEGVSA
jgi:3-phosphoshikimate 1-carboxyvinyltransferase